MFYNIIKKCVFYVSRYVSAQLEWHRHYRMTVKTVGLVTLMIG